MFEKVLCLVWWFGFFINSVKSTDSVLVITVSVCSTEGTEVRLVHNSNCKLLHIFLNSILFECVRMYVYVFKYIE